MLTTILLGVVLGTLVASWGNQDYDVDSFRVIHSLNHSVTRPPIHLSPGYDDDLVLVIMTTTMMMTMTITTTMMMMMMTVTTTMMTLTTVMMMMTMIVFTWRSGVFQQQAVMAFGCFPGKPTPLIEPYHRLLMLSTAMGGNYQLALFDVVLGGISQS